MYSRPDGSWRVMVDAPPDPATGRRRRITKVVHGTRDDADLVAAALVVEVRGGRRRSAGGTVAQALEEWYAYASPEMRPYGRETTRGILDQWVLPAIGTVRLDRLGPQDLDRFYARLRTKGIGPARIRRIHGVVHRALAETVRWGKLSANPAALARPPKVPRSQIDAPDDTEVRRLLDHVRHRDEDLYTFVALAAITGCRRGELCALRWSDLDAAEGVLTVRRAISGEEEYATKTDRDRRVHLDPVTLAVLANHRTRQQERAAILRARLGRDPYVFVEWVARGRQGSHWRPDVATHRFIRLRRAAGVADTIRLHDLRHWMVTALLGAGIPVRDVSARAGHDRTSTTTDIYASHVPDNDARAAVVLAGRLAD